MAQTQSQEDPMSTQAKSGNVTLTTLFKIKERGEKFACLTAYDACFASILGDAGVEVILVGDSLGMVLQGHDSTLPVTMDDMIYHMQCVKRGNKGALLIADLPFMSYASETQTLENAAALMRAGAHMVKLEGGAWIENTTRLLAERGIPVCAHMGLTPQSVNRIGGFHVQGRDTEQADAIVAEAKAAGRSRREHTAARMRSPPPGQDRYRLSGYPGDRHRCRPRHDGSDHGAA